MPDNPFSDLFSQPSDRPLTPIQNLIGAPQTPLDAIVNIATGPTKAASTSLPPPQEKSIIEKLAEANATVRKAIESGKLNKGLQLQWVNRIINTLRLLYGEKSQFLGNVNLWRKEIAKTEFTPTAFIARLEQIEYLFASFNASASSGSLVAISRPSLIPSTNSIFIIHGHDELNRLKLERLIENDFKLKPHVLLAKPGQSAATIDKFEQCASCATYAIALFTGDDKVTTKKNDEYSQARPNVIFETGWFVGRLGKERVLILLQDGVEIHSDLAGVNRIQFSGDVCAKFREIQAELKAANLI